MIPLMKNKKPIKLIAKNGRPYINDHRRGGERGGARPRIVNNPFKVCATIDARYFAYASRRANTNNHRLIIQCLAEDSRQLAVLFKTNPEFVQTALSNSDYKPLG